MAKYIYPAIFHNVNGSYWVEFPDLPGCQTYGKTIDETVGFAQEALSGYLLTMIEDKIKFATPSNMSDIKCEENSFSTLISCNIDLEIGYEETESRTEMITKTATDLIDKNLEAFQELVK